MLILICRMFIFHLLFIPVFCTGTVGSSKTVDSSSFIQVKDNLLTVKVRDIPLKKVLKNIAKQKSIKFTFYASAEELIVADFSRLSVAKGLKKLLSDYNYTFIKGEEHKIKKVILLANEVESQHRRIVPAISYTEKSPLYEDQYDNNSPHIQEDLEDTPGSIESEIEIEYLSGALKNVDDGGKISTVETLGEIGGDRTITSTLDSSPILTATLTSAGTVKSSIDGSKTSGGGRRDAIRKIKECILELSLAKIHKY